MTEVMSNWFGALQLSRLVEAPDFSPGEQALKPAENLIK
jgi:hypothetical protein